MISTKPIMTQKEIKAAIKGCVNKQMTPWHTDDCQQCLLKSVCQPLKGKDEPHDRTK